MRIIRSAECRRMPWKNGGGETIEIAVSPVGAGLDDFDWRVSRAHVAAAGPFSIFAGIDRTLAVIDGAGIALQLAGRGIVRLTRESDPFFFPGDVPAEATLLDGAIDDLNVMTRRGRCRHRLSRLRVAAPLRVPRQGATMIVLAPAVGVTIEAGGRAESLTAGDAARLDAADVREIGIRVDSPADILVADIWPVG